MPDPPKEISSNRPNKPVASAKKSNEDIFNALYYKRLIELEKKFIHNIPDVVYHYTSLASFVQLIQSKKLWASRSEFLNDASEFKYGQKVLMSQIEALGKMNEQYGLFCEKLIQALHRGLDTPFIACFCKEGDLLSQWRGYSSHGQGISVGFRSEALQKITAADLNNVIYDTQIQTDFLFSQIKLLVESYLAVGLDLNDKDVYGKLVGQSALIETNCALLKDPAFREESELRMGVPVYRVGKANYDIKYRVRNNLIVPYIELDLSPLKNEGISEIIIGPGPDRDVRLNNVEHYLKLIKLDVPVRFSSCQFR